MAKTLAENDANIKAKKQAAKQQVGSTCTALSGHIASQGVLWSSYNNFVHAELDWQTHATHTEVICSNTEHALLLCPPESPAINTLSACCVLCQD